MGILDFFKSKQPTASNTSAWKELGAYNSRFYSFGNDLYRSAVIRSCIRPLAEFTSKAEAKSSDATLARLLNNNPNMYMNGREFLQKCRNLYELKNNVFIYIQRDNKLKPTGFYPVPYESFEALESNGRLFIKFYFSGMAAQSLTCPWEDLAVLRKDYCRSDIAGEDNNAILETLELITTTNQGVANAVKATSNLRGILKSTKAILRDDDIKAMRDRFVTDYLSLENSGGVAALDGTTEFIPINMSPTVATADQLKEFREDAYRYYGVNEKIITSSMSPEEIEAFYEIKIEPFLVDLSTELCKKCFTTREIGFGAWIVYEANKLQFASLSKKIQLFKEVVLYGGMTPNEWRAGCNMEPIEGGDELIRRLDAATVKEETEEDNNDD